MIRDRHVDVNIVDGVELAYSNFENGESEYCDAEFILEDGKYICGVETEKMSKSKFNTLTPMNSVKNTAPIHSACMKCSSAR